MCHDCGPTGSRFWAVWTRPSSIPASWTSSPSQAFSVPSGSAASIPTARIRAAMEAVLALSLNLRAFTSSELAAKVAPLLDHDTYSPSRAAYDLRKLRFKGLVQKIPRSSLRGRQLRAASHGGSAHPPWVPTVPIQTRRAPRAAVW